MSKPSARLLKVSMKLHEFDKAIVKECGGIIVGVDEAGRGSFAGPVIAAAVCLNYENPVEGVNDSKQLSEPVREQLYETILEKATAWAVGTATAAEIDKYNILEATYLAMQRALDGLNCDWKLALVDGNRSIPYLSEKKQRTIIKGDGCSASIGAASIVAKVTRDRLMTRLHKQYPEYDFISNKGYGTEEHRNVIINTGLCEIHRRSFCANLALQTRLHL